MGSERLYGDPSKWEHAIAHVDMDAFFVSCELLRRPKLRGLPVAVGPRGDRGVVAAASYEARRFGVHSALPISTARRRCPQLVVVPPDRDLYRRGSRAVMGVLSEFSDTVEVLGLDEAYVDLSDSPAPKTRARQLKLRIRERTRLACSIGIGPNRLIAKIASDLDKPDGLCVLPRERFLEVVGDRPARIIPGVGPKTDERLAAAGIRTVAELAGADTALLEGAFGPSHGASLARRAQGYGSAAVALERLRKSESRERTFETDQTDEALMRETVEVMARDGRREPRLEGDLGADSDAQDPPLPLPHLHPLTLAGRAHRRFGRWSSPRRWSCSRSSSATRRYGCSASASRTCCTRRRRRAHPPVRTTPPPPPDAAPPPGS